MWYIIPALAVIVVVAAVVRRSRATPSVAMFQAIDRGILDLQRKAIANVIPDQHGEIRGFDEQAARGSTVTLEQTIRFVYTVEQREGSFGHIVSSQLKRPKGKKYQIQCMLVVMLVLNRQLERSGIKPDNVKFEIDESALGTQYVVMILTAEQHGRIASAVTAAA
jgi:hypothetical protein